VTEVSMTPPSVFRTLLDRSLPRRSDYDGLRSSWRGDLLAGVTVGVVALPLALAFGVTSGVGAAAGLITAIVAGLVAGVLGGSSLQVSGPTGAMTVVLLPIVALHGTGAVFAVAIMGGVLVVVLGLVGLGRAIQYIPWPVVEGFTVGIATVIALQQVPFALDVPKPDGDRALLVAIECLGLIDSGTIIALALVVGVVLIMMIVPRLRRSLPASLIAVLAATVAAELLALDVSRIGAIPSSLPVPSLPMMDPETLRTLLGSAIAVAALAAIESLLSAKVADGMADGSRYNPDRELFGQGLANVASGLFGGMPATGAIARTAVNVRAGARTRVSTITHALVLLLVVLLASDLVARIPLAALAGVLIVTAVRMVDHRSAFAILRSTRSEAAVFVLTAGITILFDLILAVEIGIAVAAVLALRAFARQSGLEREDLGELTSEFDVDAEQQLLHERIAVYRLDGALFFGAAQRFLDELAAVGDVEVVILRLSGIRVLDATGANALAEMVRDLEQRGITVLLKGVREEDRPLLETFGVLAALRHEAHLFTSLDDAIAHARSHVGQSV
jgi:SulP family sulfate permease